MRKILGLILLPLLLAACHFPRPTAEPLSPTGSPTQQICYYNWATQPLPELSAQVQAALEAAGLKDITARAEAYGENCYDSQTNEVVSFAAMETDYHITVRVADLADRESLGETLEKILVVLDGFPSDTTPGPQPGFIAVSFQSDTDALNFRFTPGEGELVRQEGLQGAALLEELMK